VRYWTRAVALAPPDSEFAASLQASLAEARAPSGRLPPVASAASVSGQVTLASKLLSSVSPEDTVLVFARAADGMRMPLALMKARVKDLPLRFTLDDTSSMVPGVVLSSFDRVVLVARVSRSGMAQAQPGDLEGEVGPVATGARDILVRIDRRLE
jgi:cytochrome c-type biogenesis protein CcmH